MIQLSEFEKFKLTKRELEVLKLILKNYSNKKIADLLYIHIDTVKAHISNILYKTKTQDRLDILHKFFEEEINEMLKNFE